MKKKKHDGGGTLLISEKRASRPVILKENRVRKRNFQKIPLSLKMNTGTEHKTDLHTLSGPLIRHRLTTERMSQQYTSQNFLQNVEKIFALKSIGDKSLHTLNPDVGSENSANNSPGRSLPISDNEDDDCTLISEAFGPRSNSSVSNAPMLFTRIRVSHMSSNEAPTAFIDLLDELSDEEEMPRLVIDEAQERKPTEENSCDPTLPAISGTRDTDSSVTPNLAPISTMTAKTEQLSIAASSMSETPKKTVTSGGSGSSIRLFNSISRRLSVAPASMSETCNATKPTESSDSSASTQPLKKQKRRLSTASSSKSDTSINKQLFESISRRLAVAPHPSMPDMLNATQPIETLDGSASTQTSKLLRRRQSIAPTSMSDSPTVTASIGSSDSSIKAQLFESISKCLPGGSLDASASSQSSKISSRRFSVAPSSMSETTNTTISSGVSDIQKAKLFQTIARHLPVAPTSIPESRTKLVGSSDVIVNTKQKKAMPKCFSIAPISTSNTADTTVSNVGSDTMKTNIFQKLSKLTSEPQPSRGDLESSLENQSSEPLETITTVVVNPPVSLQPESSIIETLNEPSSINRSPAKPTNSINTIKKIPNLFNQITAQTVASAENQISCIDLIDDSSNADDMSPLGIDQTPLDPPFEIKHVRTISNPLELMESSPSSMIINTNININSFNIPNGKERLFQSMARHFPNANSSMSMTPNIHPTGSFDVPENNQPVSMSITAKSTATGLVTTESTGQNYSNVGRYSTSDIQSNKTAQLTVGITCEQIQGPNHSYKSTALQDALCRKQSNLASYNDTRTVLPGDTQQMEHNITAQPNDTPQMEQNITAQPDTSGQTNLLSRMSTNMVSSTLIFPRRKIVPTGNRAAIQITAPDRLNILSPQTINNRLFNNIPR